MQIQRTRCADLDRADANCRQADSKLDAAKQQLDKAQGAGDPGEVRAATSDVLKARFEADNAHRKAKDLGSGSPGDKLKGTLVNIAV